MRHEIASLGQEYTSAFHHLKSEWGEANLLAVALNKACTQKSFEFLNAAR
jgi:hypothetical protein